MKIAMVIPVHGSEKRLELAKRVILYYETMDVPGLQVKTVVVRDHGSDWPTTLPHVVVSHRSDPIGKKFNDGINIGTVYPFDGVMIVGSDDLIAPSVFQQIARDLPIYQELRGVHFYDSHSGEMVWDPHFLCGSGKYFSAEFLDRCDWRPYDDEADKNVDKGPNRFIGPGERLALHASEDAPVALSIEVSDNMTPWEQKTLNAHPVHDKEAVFTAMDDEWESRWRL